MDLITAFEAGYNGAPVSTAISPVQSAFSLIIFVLEMVALWKVFTKAGKPGWAAIIPIYNVIVLFQIGGQKAKKILWVLLPIIGIFIYMVYYFKAEIELCRRFGKSTGFGILAVFFGPIMHAILGFSDAKYTLPSNN